MKRLILMTSACALVAACGGERRAQGEIVTCSAYLGTLAMSGFGGGGDSLYERVNATLEQKSPKVAAAMIPIGQGGARYAQSMDPAKASAAAEAGQALAQQHLQSGNEKAAAGTIRKCAATWRRLAE